MCIQHRANAASHTVWLTELFHTDVCVRAVGGNTQLPAHCSASAGPGLYENRAQGIALQNALGIPRIMDCVSIISSWDDVVPFPYSSPYFLRLNLIH